MQIPASNFRPNRLHRLVRHSLAEVDEVLPQSTLRPPRPKCVAEKIELLVRIRPSSVIILAVDDLRLLRMKRPSAVPQTRGDGRPNLLGFHFRSAVHDGIIGEPLTRQLRVLLRYASIQGIMQKQIG